MKKYCKLVMGIALIFVLSINSFSYTQNEIVDNNIYINKKIIILEESKKYLGIPYLYGAKIGDLKHFDCSSFVKTIYRKIDVNLPRVSYEQAKIGKRVNFDELEVGDLLFFKTLKVNRISHVGIYIGNNRFIHASSKGKRVMISSLNNKYYRNRLVLQKRVI